MELFSYLFILLVVLSLSIPRTTSSLPPKKPNVIIILTDDLGYADLGSQKQEHDVRTPNLDRFSSEGVHFTAGYMSAPQCGPSRAGIITGRYQQRFGIDHIPDLPLPLKAITIAERLKPAGYVSSHVGKWDLNPNHFSLKWAAENFLNVSIKNGTKEKRAIVSENEQQRYRPKAQGFDYYFTGQMIQYYANFDLNGTHMKPTYLINRGFRVDVQTDAALAFIKRNHSKPFFLYLNYFAPHTPLELPPSYVEQFSANMPLRRRAALSMLAGIDHGVGRILAALKKLNIDENTLIFFTSDNGAPIHLRRDSPLTTDPGGWDGSLNTPLVGEKGMLAEGGIRVPMLARWPGTLPGGKVYDHPVSSLDFAATANALAGLPPDSQLDGVNLIPHLTGKSLSKPPHVALYWRFWSQAAIREGRWKLLYRSGERDRLFDLSSDEHERLDLAETDPERVNEMRRKLLAWTLNLIPGGLPTGFNSQERKFYKEHFFNVSNLSKASKFTRFHKSIKK